MSFMERNSTIREGDIVILFLSVTSQYPIEVRRFIKNKNGEFVENKFQTIYGHLDVMELVGKKYGNKVHLPRGWAYVLHPTCELWTKALPHRTQIIYTPDISLIIFGLDLAPGSVVIEAGTLLFLLQSQSCALCLLRFRTKLRDFYLHKSIFYRDGIVRCLIEIIMHILSLWVAFIAGRCCL